MSIKKITAAVLILTVLAGCALCGCGKKVVDVESLGNYMANTAFFSVYVPTGWKVARSAGPRTASIDMYDYPEDGEDVKLRVRIQVKPAINAYTQEQMISEFQKTIKKNFGSPVSKVNLGGTVYSFSSWLIYDVMDADKFDLDGDGVPEGAQEVATEAQNAQTTGADGAKVRINTKNRTELLYLDEVNHKKVIISVIGSLDTLDLQTILDSVRLTLDGSGKTADETTQPGQTLPTAASAITNAPTATEASAQ